MHVFCMQQRPQNLYNIKQAWQHKLPILWYDNIGATYLSSNPFFMHRQNILRLTNTLWGNEFHKIYFRSSSSILKINLLTSPQSCCHCYHLRFAGAILTFSLHLRLREGSCIYSFYILPFRLVFVSCTLSYNESKVPSLRQCNSLNLLQTLNFTKTTHFPWIV
jgi:hypothetical protein